jgi:hypothetical protein
MYKEFPFDSYGCSTVPFLNLDAPPGCSPFLDAETIKKHKVKSLQLQIEVLLFSPRVSLSRARARALSLCVCLHSLLSRSHSSAGCRNHARTRKCNDNTNKSWSSGNARSRPQAGPSDPPQVLPLKPP